MMHMQLSVYLLRIGLKRVFDFPLEPDEEIRMVKESGPEYAVRSVTARRRVPQKTRR